jgi:3-oxoacyl-[acyl-carrier protein] reductase/bacilysin biosynthesis oxidoreductase BacG
MDLGLRSTRCIITGASDGIGAATALAFAREGASVGLVARRRDRLDSVAADARGAGAPATAVAAADLADGDELHGALTTLIDDLGGVDVLVNNAGASRAGTIEQVDDDAWRESFDLKLMGYVRSMRLVIPAMRSQGSGCIVNVLGVAGTQPSPNYVLSCFVTALQQLTASVADQVAGDGIRVVGVGPGYTATERVMAPIRRIAEERGVPVEEFVDVFAAEQVPVGRLATAEEMATWITVMASDIAGFVTGTQLLVDGGASRSI